MYITKQLILDNTTKEMRKQAKECKTVEELKRLSDTAGFYLSREECEDAMRVLAEMED